jgi:hypothetical protein
MAKRSLDRLRVLTPCPLAAEFQEPVSHCRVCGRDVLDLSSYTREEAARLLSTSEPPCVRVMTQDGRPIFRGAAIAAGVAATLVGGAQATASLIRQLPALGAAVEQALESDGEPLVPTRGLHVTGGVVMPGQTWH